MADDEPYVPEGLGTAAQTIREGRAPPPITVRELLGYFGAQRRGIYIVEGILEALNSLHLKTEPDFQDAWIDAEIKLVPSASDVATDAASTDTEFSGGRNQADAGSRSQVRDPTFRIGALDAANSGVTSVKPDEPLSLAVTRMLAKDYSQLPVMTNPRTVKGIISWSSIGAGIGLNNKGTAVRHQMEKAYIVDSDEALLDTLPVIVDKGYVLIKGHDAAITGIVTAADVSMEFKRRAEPFLLLSEIEQHVRNLIEGKLSVEELSSVKNPADKVRKVERVADLTFGEYVLIFQDFKLWVKIGLDGVNKGEFVTHLEKVVDIRNEVMHINPDPLGNDDLEILQKSARFLQRLQTIRQSESSEAV